MEVSFILRLVAAGVALTWSCAVTAQEAVPVAKSESPAAPSEELRPKPAPGALPWEEPPRTSEPVLRPPSGAKEILERYNIGESQLAGFFNGQPLGSSEEEVLAKILYHYSRFGLDNVERWRKPDVAWDQLAAAPAEHRGEIIPIRGRALRVEESKLLPELAELLEFDHYYRVTLQIADSPYQAIICTRRIPTAWKVGEKLDEPAVADGLFLKLGDETAEQPQLYFAADRVGWLPEKPQAEAHVGPSQIELAKLGFSAGLWDDVRASKTLPLGDQDREAFYQLLSTLGKPSASGLKAAGPEPLDPVPLLKAPEEHLGEVLHVRGRVQRVMKVPVEDADIRRRLGIDHYYEIDLFLPLGEKSLKFGKDAKGGESPVYGTTFPLTLIVRDLPADLPEGEHVRDVVRADGVFFKVWTYRAKYTDQFNQLQPALMFLATQPTVIHNEPQTNTVVGGLVIAAFVVALGTALIVRWWFGWTDRIALAAAREAQRQVAPDFSKLKE
jgi:hypothetical protein